ncbi:uncharacterized protein LOC130646009 [Hydractinia symbiolongicarpus]|uniref:uncharacterized protein LOC130646009 n=1 Tax=Hydractinia symbiolongicarpus TaxID=13093 RepID=UPI00254D9185|nr:uncharacterized protein LOC130646009 [Hydractinia symbiolongicarpus]
MNAVKIDQNLKVWDVLLQDVNKNNHEKIKKKSETNEWNDVKKGPSGKIEKRYNNRFSLSNRFSTLQNEQNNNNHYDAQQLTNNQSYAPPQPKKSIRRANPVINCSPERDLLQHNIKSSETRKNKKKIRIISDSIAKRISTREFNNHLRNSDARFKVFPGSNIKNLGHYSLSTLVDENPEIVVVHVGINDLLDIKRNKSSVNEIAEKIIKLSRVYINHGVKKVFILSVVISTRIDFEFIKSLNHILENEATKYGYIFIDNSNIMESYLWRDGLHLMENGLKISTVSLKQPIDFMYLFMTKDLIDTMVMENNMCAEAEINKLRPLRRSSHLHQWKEVSSQEMRCFIAVMLHMGFLNMPTIEHYWSQDIFYNSSSSSRVMSRNRFQLILRFWHFSDNANSIGRLEKLGNLLKHFN